MFYVVFQTPNPGQEAVISAATESKDWSNIEWTEIARKDDFETFEAAEEWAENHPLWTSHPEAMMLICHQGGKTE